MQSDYEFFLMFGVVIASIILKQNLAVDRANETLRHLFPILCLITKPHKHSTIYFNILFGF